MNRISLICLAALGAISAGCEQPEPPIRKPGVVIDPCAERLHDVCGKLLLHYAANKSLPPGFEQLRGICGQSLPPVCPVSGEPYKYNPAGIEIPGRAGRLILHDATPAHSGMMWGIIAEANNENGLTARVVLLPESSVSSAGRQQSTRPSPK
jgi:hypothetical protein